MVVMPGLDPGIHQSSEESRKGDGLPGHPSTQMLRRVLGIGPPKPLAKAEDRQ